jgi:hypothetical protein
LTLFFGHKMETENKQDFIENISPVVDSDIPILPVDPINDNNDDEIKETIKNKDDNESKLDDWQTIVDKIKTSQNYSISNDYFFETILKKIKLW